MIGMIVVLRARRQKWRQRIWKSLPWGCIFSEIYRLTQARVFFWSFWGYDHRGDRWKPLERHLWVSFSFKAAKKPTIYRWSIVNFFAVPRSYGVCGIYQRYALKPIIHSDAPQFWSRRTYDRNLDLHTVSLFILAVPFSYSSQGIQWHNECIQQEYTFNWNICFLLSDIHDTNPLPRSKETALPRIHAQWRIQVSGDYSQVVFLPGIPPPADRRLRYTETLSELAETFLAFINLWR